MQCFFSILKTVCVFLFCDLFFVCLVWKPHSFSPPHIEKDLLFKSGLIKFSFILRFKVKLFDNKTIFISFFLFLLQIIKYVKEKLPHFIWYTSGAIKNRNLIWERKNLCPYCTVYTHILLDKLMKNKWTGSIAYSFIKIKQQQ